MNLVPLADLIETAGLGVKGESLFLYHMPEAVTQGILLLESLSGSTIDPELDGWRTAKVQVVVRHTDYAQGKALAEQVIPVLTMLETALTGMQVKYMRAVHEPVVYPVSKGDLLEFSVNFTTVYVVL